MARQIHELAALLSSRSEEFVRGLQKASEATRKLGKTWQKVGARVGKAAAGLGKAVAVAGTGIAVTAVKVASDAEEIQSKFEAVFKELAPQAEQFAKAFAEKIGRSVIDVKKQMAEFEDTFVPLGFARDKALELSQQLVGLTADLASFNNLSESDVQQSLTSAIVGNAEAVRKFGVVITQATLDQELMNTGIAGGVRAATEQQKALARLNLIMASTTDAQGDAERTAGSFANQMRAAQGKVKDITAAIGKELLPVLNKFLTAFNTADLSETVNSTWVPAIREAINLFGDLWIGAREKLELIGAGMGELASSFPESLEIALDAAANLLKRFGDVAVDLFKNLGEILSSALSLDLEGLQAAVQRRFEVAAIRQRADAQRAALRQDDSGQSPAAANVAATSPAGDGQAAPQGAAGKSIFSDLAGFAAEKFGHVKAAGMKMAETVGGVASALTTGSKAAQMMTGFTEKLSSTIQKAANEARLRQMERLLGGKGTKADRSFLKEQIEAKRQELRQQAVTGRFSQMLELAAGGVQTLGDKFNELSPAMDKFRDRVTEAGRSTAKSLGGEDAGRTGEAFGTLGSFLNSLSGQYVTLINNIQLLAQQLPLLDRASQRRRVLDQIERLQAILRQLTAPRQPAFIGRSIGEFAGVIGFDPGLQSQSKGSGGVNVSVNVQEMDGRNLIDTINRELQRSGHQRFL